RGESGKTRVTFIWEPVPKAAGDRQTATVQPARVSLMAIGDDGAPIFRGRVPDVAVASASPGSGATGNGSGPLSTGARGPARVTFDAKPGKMQLRVSVEGGASQV